ncbi:MAG TPA: 50S ribosomal protein L5 [Candidatus Azoamicus sp. OHIO2]
MTISKNFYKTTIIPYFIENKIFNNIMEAPKLIKVVINTGFTVANSNKKYIDETLTDLTLISSQRSIITKAKKSIAGFKVRKGFVIGCKVTLRETNMYNFLNKLITIVLPRIRDFKGLSDKSFDGHGNYSIGIKEHIIFPEIDYDKVSTVKGLDITIVTNAKTNDNGKLLLQSFKFPII